MAKGTPLKATSLFNALKFSLIPVVVLAAIVAGSVNPRPEPAQATPTGVVALNFGLCVALGSAFGGLPTVTAATSCLALERQFNMQTYIHCLRGFDADNDGVHNCLNIGVADPDNPSPLDAEAVLQVFPEDFAALDRDVNQLHYGQGSIIMAFVDDDFPVRFTTDFGRFRDLDQDIECSSAVGADFNDPDCDENPSTEGDGVVAWLLTVNEADGLGTAHVNVVQESIGIPVELTVVGTPQELTLAPLFGKDTIQTGATLATAAGAQAYSTDCNFAATTDGVLGAVNHPSKTVVVVKAFDDAGNAVVGALISWDLTKFWPDEIDILVPSGTFKDNRLKQGGVVLPQTPTLDTGPLGIAFPQFICGGKVPGKLELTASMFSEVLDPFADHDSNQKITIHVVGPATELALTAEPSVIDCNGTNTSKITANLVNAAGDPVANGLDVEFSTVALGIVTPLRSDTAAGKASTVLTPLSGANDVTADGQPRGVTVLVRALGKLNSPGDHEVLERSIRVDCTGGPPPPAEQAARNEAARNATIRPPDTGSGGQAAAGLPTWSLGMLLLGGVALAGGRLALKDRS